MHLEMWPADQEQHRVCDACWRDRERVYLERKRREAAEGKNPNRVNGGKRARVGRRGLDLAIARLLRLG
jgi:hypothetical protein